MQGHLAQFFPGLLPLLLGKILLEGNGLLEVKCLEIPIFRRLSQQDNAVDYGYSVILNQ